MSVWLGAGQIRGSEHLFNSLGFTIVSKPMGTETLAEYAKWFIVEYEVYVSLCSGNVHCLILLNSLEWEYYRWDFTNIPYNYLFEKMKRSFWCLKKPFWLQPTKHRCHPRQTTFYVGDFWVLPLFFKVVVLWKLLWRGDERQKATAERQAHLGYMCACPCSHFLRSPQSKIENCLGWGK